MTPANAITNIIIIHNYCQLKSYDDYHIDNVHLRGIDKKIYLAFTSRLILCELFFNKSFRDIFFGNVDEFE